METKVLVNRIFEIVNLLAENEGVALFASRKKGFENWLKVELSGILQKDGRVELEKNYTVNSNRKRIDIIFNNEWAISLKDWKRSVYKGRSSLLKNINALKEAPYNNYKKSCLVFLTFSPRGKKKDYDNKIESAFKKENITYYEKKDFPFNNTVFKNNNEGRLWFVPRTN